MRYININGYRPTGWQKKADQQLKRLRLCADSLQRSIYLDTAANKIWNEHKRYFERLSHNKCWFSEARASVSDYAIEHFRPKKRIDLIKSKDGYSECRTATDTNGYWWLSYELENLRLAAYKPNQLKGTYFPLETGSSIARELDNSWRKEKFMLLDPCVKSDTKLITYDGQKPIEADTNPLSVEHIRARISINLYGLERIQRLKTARAIVLQHSKNYYNEALGNWTAMNINRGINHEAYQLAKTGFANNCGYIISMLRPDKEFTSMVLAFLKGMNKQWIRDYIIENAESKRYV
ncbi:MAG: hypothetical protein EOO43_15360 [Flavobacterium sp.]|nr:MAG: hypothetical protein EOO43_15360 [Flavobacterium sp.]